jgi:hypothetical protein
LIATGLASYAVLALAEEPRPRPVDVPIVPAVRPVPEAVKIRIVEGLPAQAAPVPLRQEGKLLIGRTNMLVDGIRIGIELNRLEGAPDDRERGNEDPAEPWQQVRIEEGGFERAFFLGNGMQPPDKLAELLAEEMQLVESIHPLELDQRKKLRLAGQGDIHHLLQEIEDLRPRFEESWSAPANASRDAIGGASAVLTQAALLRNKVYAGPFGEDSLFDKNLRRIVTKAEYAQIIEKRRGKNTSNNTVRQVKKTFRMGPINK